MKAVVIGAWEETGQFLVDKLLEDPNYSKVVIFVAAPTGRQHSKLFEHIIDFTDVDHIKDSIRGDVVFSCFEPSLMGGLSKNEDAEFVFDIPVEFAEAALKNQVNSFVLLSTAGASSKSILFFQRIRGELEENIRRLGFWQYIIFRPGILVHTKDKGGTNRVIFLFFELASRFGILKKYMPLRTEFLAEKLVQAHKMLPSGTSVIENERISRF